MPIMWASARTREEKAYAPSMRGSCAAFCAGAHRDHRSAGAQPIGRQLTLRLPCCAWAIARRNRLKMIIRGHEVTMDGFDLHSDGHLVRHTHTLTHRPRSHVAIQV